MENSQMAPRKITKTAKTTKTTETAAPKRAAKPKTAKPEPKAAKLVKAAKTAAPVKKVPEAKKVKSAKPAEPQIVETKTADLKSKKIATAPAGPANQTGGLTPLAAAILLAIQEGRAVEFIFADADTNPPRTFEPRQLIFDTFAKAWFVWGWDRRYNAERHHRVDLLSEVNAVEGVGRSAQGPYKEGTSANQIGGWLGGEPIPVKVVLLKQWIYAVKQAPAPFPEFRLEDSEEGKAIVSFTGTDLRAIARWCMQFGDGIQVLEPQRLIDRIKQVGALWAGKPKQEIKPVQAAPKLQPPVPRPESRHETRPEPRHEPRPEPRSAESRSAESRPAEPARRPQRIEAPKESRESESQKPKSAGRVEIRIDRL
jgi:predicted DNA-binding transcriptional regulator YafY